MSDFPKGTISIIPYGVNEVPMVEEATDAIDGKIALRPQLEELIGRNLTEMESEECYEEAKTGVGKALWMYNMQKFVPDSKELGKELEYFRLALGKTVTILDQSPEKKDLLDWTILARVAQLSERFDPGLPEVRLVQKYAQHHADLAAMLKDVERACDLFKAFNRGGRRQDLGHQVLVKTGLAIAEKLGIALTAGGDRSKNADDTPFVRLTFEILESYLPDEHRCDQMASCRRAISRDRAFKTARDAAKGRSPATKP